MEEAVVQGVRESVVESAKQGVGEGVQSMRGHRSNHRLIWKLPVSCCPIFLCVCEK